MFIVQLPNSKLSFPYYDRLPTQPAPVSQTSASEISILLGKCGGAVHRYENMQYFSKKIYRQIFEKRRLEFSIITIKNDSFFKPYSSSEILDLSCIFKTQVRSASELMVPPLAGASDMFIYVQAFSLNWAFFEKCPIK